MPKPTATGFQPRTTPAERRADFDARRRISNAVVNAGGVANIRALTQAEYDAIATPDPNTLYVIIP